MLDRVLGGMVIAIVAAVVIPPALPALLTGVVVVTLCAIAWRASSYWSDRL